MRRLSFGLLLLAAAPVDADPLVVRAAVTQAYDSNIFRLPGGLQPQDGKGRDDTILQGQLGGHYETRVSLQRFVLDGAATRYEYRDHDSLSFTGISATGTWYWQVGSRFAGNAGYDYQRRQTSFAEFRSQGRNIVTVRQPFVEGRYQPGATLFAYAGFRHIAASNTSSQLRPADYRSDVASGGAGYALRNGGELRLGVRRTDTSFPNNQVVLIGGLPFALRNDFRLEEVETSIAYPFTALTSLNGRVAYTKRTVEQLPARDFSGITGRLALDYRPSALWSFELAARRELSGSDDILTNFATVRALSGFAEYHPADFWSVRLEGQTSRRRYQGFASVAPTAGREDSDRYVALSTGYQWRLGTRFDLSLRRESRNSSIDTLDYKDTSGFASLTLAFGSPQVVR